MWTNRNAPHLQLSLQINSTPATAINTLLILSKLTLAYEFLWEQSRHKDTLQQRHGCKFDLKSEVGNLVGKRPAFCNGKWNYKKRGSNNFVTVSSNSFHLNSIIWYSNENGKPLIIFSSNCFISISFSLLL